MSELNQHIRPKGIVLTYSCEEDLDRMSNSEKGKFCTECKREVIDFTKMSLAEIQQIRGSESKMCGIFLPEQLDPTLHPIEIPNVRKWAFLSSVLLSLNFGTANAQSTVDPKIEQSQGTSNAPNLTPEEAKMKSERGQHISMSIGTATPEINSNSAVTNESQKTIKRKKWYWSKRFPFLKRRKVIRRAGYFF